jgi:small-conductance mechanosensitive channel
VKRSKSSKVKKVAKKAKKLAKKQTKKAKKLIAKSKKALKSAKKQLARAKASGNKKAIRKAQKKVKAIKKKVCPFEPCSLVCPGVQAWVRASAPFLRGCGGRSGATLNAAAAADHTAAAAFAVSTAFARVLFDRFLESK